MTEFEDPFSLTYKEHTSTKNAERMARVWGGTQALVFILPEKCSARAIVSGQTDVSSEDVSLGEVSESGTISDYYLEGSRWDTAYTNIKNQGTFGGVTTEVMEKWPDSIMDKRVVCLAASGGLVLTGAIGSDASTASRMDIIDLTDLDVPLAQYGNGAETVEGKIAGVVEDGATPPYIQDGVIHFLSSSSSSTADIPLAQYNNSGVSDVSGKIASVEFGPVSSVDLPKISYGNILLPLAHNEGGSSVDTPRAGGMIGLAYGPYNSEPNINDGTGIIPKLPTFDPTYFEVSEDGEVALKESALDALADEAVSRIQLDLTAEGDLTPTEFSATLGTLQAQANYSGSLPEDGLNVDSHVLYTGQQ